MLDSPRLVDHLVKSHREPALLLEGATVALRASGTLLVEDVSLAAPAGEVLAIVGETGAGKTLTLRACLGLLPAGLSVSGRMSLAGESVALDNAGRLAAFRGDRITIVLQDAVGSLDPLQRIGSQLVEGVRLRRLATREEAVRRAAGLLAALGFAEPANVFDLYPHQLSGGMAQRVTIAIALMPAPAVVVADEPTSALDANLRKEILLLMRRLAADQGVAVVIVSHDLTLVGQYADKVAVMYGARIVESGPTGVVLRRPLHPYTVALIASVPSLDTARRRALPVIAGTPPRPGAWPSGCVFAPRCPVAIQACAEVRPALYHGPERAVACHLAEAGA